MGNKNKKLSVFLLNNFNYKIYNLKTTATIHGLGFFGKEPKAEITVALVPVAFVVNEGCTSPAGFNDWDAIAFPPGWSHLLLRFFASSSCFFVPETTSTFDLRSFSRLSISTFCTLAKSS